MSDAKQKVEELDRMIQEKRHELEDLYKKVNMLCELFDIPHDKYEVKEEKKAIRLTLKGDEYFRRPMATVITLILQDRKVREMGPATLEEILEKMSEGGYVFNVKEPKIAVGTALGKNMKFTKIGDKWGLTEWYPKVKEPKGSITNNREELEEEAEEATEATEATAAQED
jgi:septum formation inhibitor MinC